MASARSAALGVFIAIASTAFAADSGIKPRTATAQKSHVQWAKEPQQFMGINVDGSESNLCHIAVSDFSPCLVDGELINLPDLGFSIEGSGLEFERKVAYLSLQFDHENAARMALLLVKKYGAPTAKRTSVLTSVMGVRVSDTQYEWAGANVDIVFKEHDNNLTKGSVLVTSVPVWNAYQADYVKQNGNPADHL